MNELGEKGELVAGKFLQVTGFMILERNYTCPLGEIDIIAKRNEVWHFVEVKSRTNLDYGLPADAVNIFKQRKVKALASYYMMVNRYLGDAVCDIVEVIYDPISKRYLTNFIENAF
jgi:putative endonuclease